MISLKKICSNQSSNIAMKDLEFNNGQYPIFGASGFIKNVDFYKQEKPYIAVVKDGAGVGRVMKLPAKSSIIGTMQYIIPNDNIDISYLAYAMENMNLAKYCSGATIPHIYFKDYCKETLPDYTIAEQKQIANTLDKVTDLIDKHKKQLEKLDELVKARFVEMFGDIGVNKYRGKTLTLKECCIINPQKTNDDRLHSGLEVSFIPMPCVSENGDIDASQIKEYDEVKTGFTYFSENDVLFAKITPCMENGKGAIARGLKNGIGFGSTEFHVLRPTNELTNPYWLYVLTTFKQFRKDAESNMTGSAGQRRVPVSFIENYRVYLPPIELQDLFANFVKQVEKTKTEVQKSLEQAETLKKALMQKYFG